MRVAFYVGGGLEHGTGHLYRCEALARGLETDDSAVFLVDGEKTDLLRLCDEIGLECMRVEEGSSYRDRAESVRARSLGLGADVLVLDLFEVDAAYLRALKSATEETPMVALDDYSITRPIPHVVIKPHLVEEWYAPRSSWEGTTLLTGTDYWILRPGLRELAQRDCRVRKQVETVLVTMGGSDPRQVTKRVVEVLGTAGTVPHLQVACGPGYPDVDGLRGTADEVSGQPEIEILRAPENFDRLMFDCDLAVTAGGYTVYELAALGTPMVILPWVQHQMLHARAMASRGAAVSMDLVDDSGLGGLKMTVAELLADVERRERMSAAGRETVDGDGVERVADVLRSVA